MSLEAQLTARKGQSIAKLPAETVNKILHNEIDRLNASGLADNAPKVGEKLNDFSLLSPQGDKRSLVELREKGPVAITFYRGGWCPYCNLELRAYQEVLEEIKAAGATLVAITPELPDASLSTTEKNELKFEVLTDINSAYATELGLLYHLPEELRPVYGSLGIDVEKHNGEGRFDLPLGATFVVDTDGTIVFAFVNVDYTQRAEPADVVEVLQSLKKGS